MTKTRQSTIVLANALLLTMLWTTIGDAQQDQRAVARQLLQGSRVERSRALETAKSIGRTAMDADLRAALITVLERNNRTVAQALARKEPVSMFEDPEFVSQVAHVVSELGDPQAIPALAGALGTGSTLVRDALADFGERAAPAVLAVVSSPESHYSAVDEGLIALRFMVEGVGPSPLSAATLNQVRRATRERLTGNEYFTTLWRAIDLAVALNDPSLRQIVQSLASDATEVSARGVTNPDLMTKTQQWATERLAGGASNPRYRTPGERNRLLAPR